MRTLQESLSLEKLLVDISARLIGAPLERIDGEIIEALHQVREFFRVDRCGLLELLEGTNIARVSHASYAEGIEQVPGEINLTLLFPWSYEKLFVQGVHVTVSRLDDLPPEALTDRNSHAAMGARSTLNIPLLSGGRVSHAIVIQSLSGERSWPDECIPRLRLLGHIVVTALVRKKADQALRESEARLSLAADSANVGLWELDLATGLIWATNKVWSLFGLGAGEAMTFEQFLAMVHPEDREPVERAVRETSRSSEDNSVDYRILRPDGAIRWFTSRGRAYFSSSGVPERLMGVTVDITERKQVEELTQRQFQQIHQLKLRLEQENVYLQREIKGFSPQNRIVGQSSVMKSVVTQATQVAQTDSTVLLLGETGTGKELLARAIHDLSRRRGRPLITVNCASLPPSLIEAELFGREKGAYTGALSRAIGRFELADNSTIFLDEIGELPLELQAKLLRVLENGTFERLGSPTPITVNLRIIAATNRDLHENVTAGTFRSDLYYRLNVFPIVVPPLRERREDIPLLVWSMVKEFRESMGRSIEWIPEKTMQALTTYDWPGNIRELRNVIERAMIITSGAFLEVVMPKSGMLQKAAAGGTLADVEREHILAVLSGTRWRITGKGGAAELLGLERTTLYSKMKKLGISRPIV